MVVDVDPTDVHEDCTKTVGVEQASVTDLL